MVEFPLSLRQSIDFLSLHDVGWSRELGNRYTYPCPEAGVQLGSVHQTEARTRCEPGEELDRSAPEEQCR